MTTSPTTTCPTDTATMTTTDTATTTTDTMATTATTETCPTTATTTSDFNDGIEDDDEVEGEGSPFIGAPIAVLAIGLLAAFIAARRRN